jgi:uncharacterized protein YndB with AHSA1/START domain
MAVFHLAKHAARRRWDGCIEPSSTRTQWRSCLPPHGFTGKVHHLDAKVGGTFTMSFTNFTTGESHSFGGEYLERTPHERIRHTDKFDDPNLPGEMRVRRSP